MKEINSNFNLKYKRRTTSNRRSFQHQNTHQDTEVNNQINVEIRDVSKHQIVDGIVLEKYRRCYVEDFMTRTVSEKLLVLIPIDLIRVNGMTH